MHKAGSDISGFVGILVIQLTFIVLYGIFVRYDDALLPPHSNASSDEIAAIKHEQGRSYPHFQDINVMIFMGFGLLMTFLKKYGFSGSGFNLLLATMIIQWAFLVRGCFNLVNGQIRLSLTTMIEASVTVAAVLISMGALLGRTTPIQLLFMGLIETIVYAANEYFQLHLLKIADAGGSITVHAFGAYFGLAVSFMMRPKPDQNNSGSNECSSYMSDLFAMIGTLFLWVFWPSFNSALLDDVDQQQRTILNTYLSLTSAAVTTFVVSGIVGHGHKLDMVHIQNSTLAGGVAVGSVCNMLIGPHGALLIGSISAIICVLGYRYLTPILTSKLRIHDTCGVNNLHGMPALLSAGFSAIYAALATADKYRDSLGSVFPAMNSRNSSFALEHNSTIALGGFGRAALEQGGYQLLGMASTVIFAIIAGVIVGIFMNSPAMRNLRKDEHHDDETFWSVAESDKVM